MSGERFDAHAGDLVVVDSLDLATLNSIANLSRSHYSMPFKRCTGISLIDYFTGLLVEWACELLDETELSIKQVAASIGYPDALALLLAVLGRLRV